jgi:hypothetical protein
MSADAAEILRNAGFYAHAYRPRNLAERGSAYVSFSSGSDGSPRQMSGYRSRERTWQRTEFGPKATSVCAQ